MLELPDTALGRARDWLDDRLYMLNDLRLAAVEWRGDLVRYAGTEKHSGAPFSMLYFGIPQTGTFLADMLFADYRIAERRERIAAWNGAEHLTRAGTEVDLVMGDLSWPYWHLIAVDRFLRVAPSVSHKIPLAGDWPTMEAEYRKRKTTRDDVNRAATYGFEFSLTQDTATIEHFYDNMYVPYATARHGQFMQVESREALIHIAQHGAFVKVMHEGRFVGGGVLYRMLDSLRYLWFGILQDLDPKLADGLRSAIYFHSIKLGIEIGCKDLDLLYTPPLLNNGIYRYKRKLGTKIVNEWHYSRVALRATSFGPAVVSALTKLPLAIPNEAGGMRGRMLVDKPGLTVKQLRSMHADNAILGMDRLQVFSLAPLSAEVQGAEYPHESCPLELRDLSALEDGAAAYCALGS